MTEKKQPEQGDEAERPVEGQGLSAAMLAMPSTAVFDARNSHKGYDYSSADAVFKAVRPSLAAAGLGLWMDQKELEVIQPFTPRSGEKPEAPWIKATYDMAMTPNGEAPAEDKTERITVMERLRDAQSLGSVRTYAAKYYLRPKTLLATGERDTDDSKADGPPPAAARAPAGKWTVGPDLVLRSQGKFKTKKEAAAEFYKLIMRSVSDDTIDDERRLKLVENNRDGISRLTDQAKEEIARQVKGIKDRLSADQEAQRESSDE
ncbi:MAG: ERF family protein [Acidobacteria bacterium]|nr:ERF family protein [Acidobacteriota bacterium]